MNQVRVHIGVDVGKEWLEICYPDGEKEEVRNIKSCRTKVIKRAARVNAIVCFEATGPYEEPLADECLAKGVRAVRLDAWGARRFAESQGRIEKTDRIDCEMIRDYAASLKDEKLHFIKPRSEAQKRLKKSVSVRRNLMKARAIVYNQLEHIRDRDSRRHLESSIAKLDKEIARIEAECDKAIADDERMKRLSDRFLKVKGVGPCLVRTVLACCPDIGDFNSKSIAKMCGNAPIDHESCTPSTWPPYPQAAATTSFASSTSGSSQRARPENSRSRPSQDASPSCSTASPDIPTSFRRRIRRTPQGLKAGNADATARTPDGQVTSETTPGCRAHGILMPCSRREKTYQ